MKKFGIVAAVIVMACSDLAGSKKALADGTCGFTAPPAAQMRQHGQDPNACSDGSLATRCVSACYHMCTADRRGPECQRDPNPSERADGVTVWLESVPTNNAGGGNVRISIRNIRVYGVSSDGSLTPLNHGQPLLLSGFEWNSEDPWFGLPHMGGGSGLRRNDCGREQATLDYADMPHGYRVLHPYTSPIALEGFTDVVAFADVTTRNAIVQIGFDYYRKGAGGRPGNGRARAANGPDAKDLRSESRRLAPATVRATPTTPANEVTGETRMKTDKSMKIAIVSAVVCYALCLALPLKVGHTLHTIMTVAFAISAVVAVACSCLWLEREELRAVYEEFKKNPKSFLTRPR